MNAESLVGANVRAARTSRGWSQHRLAERIGLHQTTVAKLEQAGRPIRVNEVFTIAAVLNVPIAQLLLGTEPSAQQSVSAAIHEAQTRAAVAETLDRITGFISTIYPTVAS